MNITRAAEASTQAVSPVSIVGTMPPSPSNGTFVRGEEGRGEDRRVSIRLRPGVLSRCDTYVTVRWRALCRRGVPTDAAITPIEGRGRAGHARTASAAREDDPPVVDRG